VTGFLTVAAVMRPFTRLVPGRSLKYWWSAWVILSGSLGLLYLGQRAERAGMAATPVFLAGFCLMNYLFGYLVWAGCRTIDTADRLRPAAWWGFSPFAVVAVVLPVLVPDSPRLLQIHTLFTGLLFAAACWTLRPRSKGHYEATPGRWLMRVALVGLVVVDWYHTFADQIHPTLERDWDGPYQGDWVPLLLIAVLAFGMVSLAADRVQAELANRNQQLAHATEELARAARTDPLTGLLNRRALNDFSADLASRAGGCVAVLDLNDLKPLNDKFGHPAGDAALQVLARTLRTLFRVTDPIFRTGGDEFLVVMPGGSRADMTTRLSALNSGLTVRIEGPDSSREEMFTVAWGVADWASGKDLWAAIHEADVAMYAVKKKTKSGTIRMPAARSVPPA
jgi:diguanylate cyclase (GGDEF)-like protein